MYGVRQASGASTITNSNIHSNQGSGGNGVYISTGTSTVSSNQIHDNAYYGVAVVGGTVTLTDNTFSNNWRSAVYVDFNGDPSLTHTGNSSSGTSGINGIVVSGYLYSDQTLTAGDLPYVIFSYSTFYVSSGTTLTLEPGAILKLGSQGVLTVDGTLNAQGTSTSAIYFTSLSDDSIGGDTNNDWGPSSPAAGDWDTIQVDSGGTANISYALISYGGYNNFNRSKAELYLNGGTVNLDNSEVATVPVYDVRQDSGVSTITNSNIHNANAGFYLVGGSASISSNSIHDNVYGIYAVGGNLCPDPDNNNYANNTVNTDTSGATHNC